MADYQPYNVIGFHSCDRAVGLRVLNGADQLRPSDNPWDWLGPGIYFWEQNPLRALEYAVENAAGRQFNKKRSTVPFVLGAVIELGNCLNLTESGSLALLAKSYEGLQQVLNQSNRTVPINKGANRALDCAVIRYLHESHVGKGHAPFNTVRCAFSEGGAAYPGSEISARLHIRVCVLNAACIKGVFLPQPAEAFNPNLRAGAFEVW